MGEIVDLSKHFVPARVRELQKLAPPLAHGIIIGPKPRIRGSNISVSNSVDPIQLRRYALFFDRIAYPTNSFIGFGELHPDLAFLRDCNLLSQPHILCEDGDAAKRVGESYGAAFSLLEADSPGAWSLAAGPNELDLAPEIFETSRGAITELVNSVPLPDRDAPLEDVLDFKFKRKSELLAFRQVTDGFYQSWVVGEDRMHALTKAKGEIERACHDLIRAYKAAKLPFKMSSWSLSYSLNPITAAVAFNVLDSVPATSELPSLTTLALAGASQLRLSKSVGPKRKTTKSSPYRYAAEIHERLG